MKNKEDGGQVHNVKLYDVGGSDCRASEIASLINVRINASYSHIYNGVFKKRLILGR